MFLTNNVKVMYNLGHKKHVTGIYQDRQLRVHCIPTVLVEKTQVCPSIREEMNDRSESVADRREGLKW